MVSKIFHMKRKTKSNDCERESDDERTIHGRSRERERERAEEGKICVQKM